MGLYFWGLLGIQTSCESFQCCGIRAGCAAPQEDCASDAGILRLAKSTPDTPEYVRRCAGQGSNVTSLQAGQGEARRLACAKEAREG